MLLAQSASEGLVADLLHEHCKGKGSLRSLAWLSSSMHAGTACAGRWPALLSLQPPRGFTGSLDELKDELDEPLCFGAHPLMTFMTQAGKFLEQGVTAPNIHTETKRASWRALCLQHCC